ILPSLVLCTETPPAPISPLSLHDALPISSPCLPVPSRAVGRVRRGAARALARRSEGPARSGPRRLDPGTVAAGRPLPRRTGWSGGEGGAVPASPGRGGSGVTGGAVRVSERRRDRPAGCGGA